MANYRRKRTRKQVKCSLCTPNREGNTKNGTSGKVKRQAARQAATPADY